MWAFTDTMRDVSHCAAVLCICYIQVFNSKNKRVEITKLVRTFPLGRSNRRANFQLTRPKVKVTGRQKRHGTATHLAYLLVDGGLRVGRSWRRLQTGPNYPLCGYGWRNVLSTRLRRTAAYHVGTRRLHFSCLRTTTNWARSATVQSIRSAEGQNCNKSINQPELPWQ